MVGMTDAHRLFLQTFVKKSMMNESSALKLHLSVINGAGGLKDFHVFLSTVNKQLCSLHMEIRRGRDEHDGKVFYALVNLVEDEYAKMATDISPHQMEFVKRLIEMLVFSDNGFVSSIDLLNLGSELPMKLNAHDVEHLLLKLTKRKWLTEMKGNISLGLRLIIELRSYLKSKFKDQIAECLLCKDIVMTGEVCAECNTKFHSYCLATALVNVSNPTCPYCEKAFRKATLRP